MINVFYHQTPFPRMHGPTKVIINLIRSLEDCDINFSINSEKYDNNLFLHWDQHHLPKYHGLKNKQKLLVGPQASPYDPLFDELKEYGKYIVPSDWVKGIVTKNFDIPDSKLLVWPVAIYRPEIEENQTIDCLVYYKNRPVEDFNRIVDLLSSKGMSYTYLQYGNYSQEEFKQALSAVKFCVIVDNTESQGIAIQEMMSVNKPLFVWDQLIWDSMGEDQAVPATSVPYWSDECGVKCLDKDNLEEDFDKFLSNINDFSPADYVEKNLSNEKSLQILVDYYSE